MMIQASKELAEQTKKVESAFLTTFLTAIAPNHLDNDESQQLMGEVVERLKQSHFASPEHIVMWQAICDVIADGAIPDIVTISNKIPLDKKSNINSMLLYYLSPDNADSLAWRNCRHFLDKVLSYATQRDAIIPIQIIADTICNPSDDIVSDINDAISTLGVVAEVAEKQSANVPLSPDFPSRKKKKYLERLKGLQGKQITPPTGFKALDEVVRLQEGEITVIGARPSMGKSALASAIACNVADNDPDKAVLFFTLEMTDSTCYNRIASCKLRIPHNKFRDGELTETEMELVDDFLDNNLDNLYIFDDCRQIDQICARIRRINAIQPVSLVVIDYLGLIMPSEQERTINNLTTQIASYLQKLKLTITNLKLPLLLLSQLNREVESKRDHTPKMNHLRDSGNIEQDAGTIMFLRRPAYYATAEEQAELTEQQKKLALVDVVKNRNGDPRNDIPLKFEGEFVSFLDIDGTPPPIPRTAKKKSDDADDGTYISDKDIPL